MWEHINKKKGILQTEAALLRTYTPELLVPDQEQEHKQNHVNKNTNKNKNSSKRGYKYMNKYKNKNWNKNKNKNMNNVLQRSTLLWQPSVCS